MTNAPVRLSLCRRPLAAMLLGALLTLSLAVGAAQPGELGPYVQRFEDGWIDWQEGKIYGVGKATLKANRGSKLQAQRAAQALARASIVKIAARIQLDDRHKIETYEGGRLRSVLRAVIHDEALRSELAAVADPYVEVTRVAPIKGVDGLTSELLPYLHSGAGAPAAAQPPAELGDGEEGPWLLLDASRLSEAERLDPALFPQIRSAGGAVLYRSETVERSALRARGMAEYAVGLETGELGLEVPAVPSLADRLLDALGVREAHAQEERKRRRRRDFIVAKVEGAEGLAKTNLVVSEQDARRLQAANAKSGVLKKCRVVILVSGAVGGVEGRRHGPGPVLATRLH